jgi:hypothetical protein
METFAAASNLVHDQDDDNEDSMLVQHDLLANTESQASR